MREIKSLEEVLYLLKSQITVVQIIQGIPVYFIQKEEKIKVIGNGANYMLDVETFKSLFEHEKFYEVEKKQKDGEISVSKDEEYYSWKHK